MPNKILDGITKEEAIAGINGKFKFLCPNEIGIKHFPNILNNGCNKCWEKALNTYYETRK